MWLIVAGPLVLALIIGGAVWLLSGAGRAAEADALPDVTDGFLSNLYVNGVNPIKVTGGSSAVMGYVGMSSDGQKHAVLAQTERISPTFYLALADATSKEMQQIGEVTSCSDVFDDSVYCSFLARKHADYSLRQVSLKDGSLGPVIDSSNWGEGAIDPINKAPVASLPTSTIHELGPSASGGKVLWVQKWTLGASANWFAVVVGPDGSTESVQLFDRSAGIAEGCVLATTRDKVMCETLKDETKAITVLDLTAKTQATSDPFPQAHDVLLTADAALVDPSGGPIGIYGGEGIRFDYDLNTSQQPLHSILIEPDTMTDGTGADIVYTRLDDLLNYQPSDYSTALVDHGT